MPDDSTRFDNEEIAAAERLDAEITAVLEGRSPADADQTSLWLASSMRPPIPRGVVLAVANRVTAPARVAWRPLRIAAAALAAVLAAQGISGLLAGEWVAENLGEPFGSHAFTEGGLAAIAVSVAVAAAALRPAFAPIAVAAGVPLGLILGIRGVEEIGEFGAGAALHLSEGLLALMLLGAWWRTRRYGPIGGDEHEI